MSETVLTGNFDGNSASNEDLDFFYDVLWCV